MKDLIFRSLHSLKHKILNKFRRVIFFRLHYFPYVSKESKKEYNSSLFQLSYKLQLRLIDLVITIEIILGGKFIKNVLLITATDKENYENEISMLVRA